MPDLPRNAKTDGRALERSTIDRPDSTTDLDDDVNEQILATMVGR